MVCFKMKDAELLSLFFIFSFSDIFSNCGFEFNFRKFSSMMPLLLLLLLLLLFSPFCFTQVLSLLCHLNAKSSDFYQKFSHFSTLKFRLLENKAKKKRKDSQMEWLPNFKPILFIVVIFSTINADGKSNLTAISFSSSSIFFHLQTTLIQLALANGLQFGTSFVVEVVFITVTKHLGHL